MLATELPGPCNGLQYALHVRSRDWAPSWSARSQAVTRNELYGYLHPATREWKEGLISVTYRDMANNRTNKHQWILLDGDIDAEWIEVLRAKARPNTSC